MARLRHGRWPAAGLAAGLAAVLIAHGGSLDNSFHYDDIHSVVENPHIRSLAAPAAFFSDPQAFSARPERAMYRPLVVLSHAVNYALGGYDPSGYLLVNLVAHVACSALVGALGIALGLPATVSMAAALLFALHPVNSEVVNYVSSRSEALSCCGMLAALSAYARWRQGLGGWPTYILGVTALALGLLSKATAIAVAPMLLVYEWITPGPRRIGFLVPFLALATGYALIVSDPAGQALGEPVRPLSAHLWTQLKALPYYLYLLALPVHLAVEHDFAVDLSAWSPPVTAAAALTASVAALAWRRLCDRGRMLGGWAVLALAPASLVPLNVLVNEHRLYPAAACLALLATGWLWRSRKAVSRGRLWAGAIVALATLSTLSHHRTRVWDTELTLWSEAVARAPGSYRSHMHLGGALEAAGDVSGALARYREAARLAPDRAEPHYNLGNALRQSGDPTAARQAWEHSLQVQPDFLDALLNLAAYHQDLGDLEEAGRLLRRAHQAHPQSAEVWRRQGVLARRGGDTAGARQAYERALRLDPSNAETHHNLANLLYGEGEIAAAAERYERALVLEPHHHGAANNLAHLRLSSGDAAAAESVCRDALRLSPGQSKLFYLLAQAQDAQGKRAEALSNYRIFLRSGDAAGTELQAVRLRIAELEASQGNR